MDSLARRLEAVDTRPKAPQFGLRFHAPSTTGVLVLPSACALCRRGRQHSKLIGSEDVVACGSTQPLNRRK